MPGPLHGLRVLEIASEWGAYTGKLVADLGAEVVLVEPPGGHPTRAYGPFAGDEVTPETSLWFWHYNTNKLGVVLDLAAADDRARLDALLDAADVFIEAEGPGVLSGLGLGFETLHERHPDLVMVSITAFDPGGPRRDEVATDLTILATGGPVWSCGYDDHSLPPIRGGGNQASHIGGHYAVMSLLVALLARGNGRSGQHIAVDLGAAANVTTEVASYGYLTAGQTVFRQTGRHAHDRPTQPTQVQCADGRYLNTGLPPRRPAEFAALRRWLVDLGGADEGEGSALIPLLTMGEELESLITVAQVGEDPLIREIFGAGRDAVSLIASKLDAYAAFIGFQERGIPVGVIYSPEEVLTDPHFLARGWPVELEHAELGRTVTYPGAPYAFRRTPWSLRRRAPHLAEHDAAVLGGSGTGPRFPGAADAGGSPG